MSDLVSLPVVCAQQYWTDVSVQGGLLTYAAVGIPAGLLLGAALGLVARPRTGGTDAAPGSAWQAYGSFPRRAVRLAHVAAVMLPALAGLYGLLLGAAASGGADSAAALWGARLWIAGGLWLPAALVAAAFRPRGAWHVALPATCVVAASLLFAAALLQGGVR